MKNIHVLPKKSFNQIGVDHYGKTPTQIKIAEFLINKKIYITSNEEIKEGDWTLMFDSVGHLFLFDKPQQYLGIEKGHHLNKGLRKIILTTDQDLIKVGVQAIDDEFLGWFVKNWKCENVHVYKEYKQINQDNIVTKGSTASVFSHYVIYIPKEEPKQELRKVCKCKRAYENPLSEICSLCWNELYPNEKDEIKDEDLLEPIQETLEEAAVKYSEGWGENDDTKSFIQGAKWQQERMYSEEEVKQIIDATLIEYSDFVLADIPHWFEQFKKK